MRKTTITIENKEVELATSAALPILYRELFTSDLFKEMAVITKSAKETGAIPYESIYSIYQLAYAMAKHANDDIAPYMEWFSQFDDADAIIEHLNEIINLWTGEQAETSAPKKKKDQ